MGVVDKDFFEKLESKLSYVKLNESRGYSSRHLGDDEFQEVLKFLQNNPNAILYPVPGPQGLFPTYVLGEIKRESSKQRIEELLHFSNHQLPKHYSFENLSNGIFAKPENIAKAKNCGIVYSTKIEDYRPKAKSKPLSSNSSRSFF